MQSLGTIDHMKDILKSNLELSNIFFQHPASQGQVRKFHPAAARCRPACILHAIHPEIIMKRIRQTGDGIKPREDNNNNSSRDSTNSNNNLRSAQAQNSINRATGNTSSSSRRRSRSNSPPVKNDCSDSDSNMGIPDSQVDAQAHVLPLGERDASDDNSHGSRRSTGSNTNTNSNGGNASPSSAALEANDEQDGGGCSSSGGSASALGENDIDDARTFPPYEAAADRNDEIMENAGAGDGGGATVGGAHQLNVLVLVRLLFHYLEKVDPQLLLEAKRALKDCDRRKRDGDPGYQQLSEIIPRRLRRIVGDKHWGRALAIQRNYLLQKKRKKKQRDEMMQHRRHISRNKEKMGRGVNPNVVSMESSVDTSVQASATSVPAASAAASASAASASATAQHHLSDTGANSPFPSSPSPSAVPIFNPGLLHRVVVNTTSSASTSRAGNGDSPYNNQAHILSPFEVAQRALAAQVEAYNRASTQMGLDTQMQQQAFGFPPAPEAQEALLASVAASAWQGRIPMSSCHTDDSSESSS